MNGISAVKKRPLRDPHFLLHGRTHEASSYEGGRGSWTSVATLGT